MYSYLPNALDITDYFAGYIAEYTTPFVQSAIHIIGGAILIGGAVIGGGLVIKAVWSALLSWDMRRNAQPANPEK